MTDAIEQGGTAMSTRNSAPGVRYLYDQGLIRPGMKVIDYGAGHGRNALWLRKRDVEVYAYDPYLGFPGHNGWKVVSSEPPTEHADVLFTSFVLNVLTRSDELEVLRDIKGLSYFTYHIVRNEDLLVYGRDRAINGFKTSRGYQRLTTVQHRGIICIRQVYGYRIYEGQLYSP